MEKFVNIFYGRVLAVTFAKKQKEKKTPFIEPIFIFTKKYPHLGQYVRRILFLKENWIQNSTPAYKKNLSDNTKGNKKNDLFLLIFLSILQLFPPCILFFFFNTWEREGHLLNRIKGFFIAPAGKSFYLNVLSIYNINIYLNFKKEERV